MLLDTAGSCCWPVKGCGRISLVSTERYSSVWFGTVLFRTVPLDLACVSTANCILTWWAVCMMDTCSAAGACVVPRWNYNFPKMDYKRCILYGLICPVCPDCVVPCRQLKHGQHVSFRAPTLWNGLSLDIRQACSIEVFKSKTQDPLVYHCAWGLGGLLTLMSCLVGAYALYLYCDLFLFVSIFVQHFHVKCFINKFIIIIRTLSKICLLCCLRWENN